MKINKDSRPKVTAGPEASHVNRQPRPVGTENLLRGIAQTGTSSESGVSPRLITGQTVGDVV